jgi:replicative DNA helicase
MSLDTSDLQSRLLGAYLANPEAASVSPFIGRLSTILSGKWATLGGYVDAILAANGEPNQETVFQYIMAHPYEGGADGAITPEEVMDLPGSKSAETIKGYERQVSEWTQQKRVMAMLRATASEIDPTKRICDPAAPLAALVENLRGIDSSAGADTNLGHGLSEAIEQAELARRNREAGLATASWGVPAVDRICPLEPGRMYVLAAAPKCGKTSLAMMAATATAEVGGRVAFASLEMRASELACVMAARVLGFDTRAFRRGMMPSEDMDTIRSLAEDWKRDDRIIIRDTRADAHRCADICAWIKLRQRMLGNLSLVIVDYLQLMESSDPRKSEYETVTQNTRKLKLLATNLNLPIIVLSQMNRDGRRQQMDDGRKAGQVEPTLGSLRSSGSIEQDADAVAFLWSEKEPDQAEKYRKVQFKLEASRFCETGKAALMFYGPQQTFSDASTHIEKPDTDRGAKLRSTPSNEEDLFNTAGENSR